MATPTTALTVSEYMRQPEITQRFSEVLGNESQANSYIQSVLILVQNDDKLRECTSRSIYNSAMRAASLGLSCDPSLKQAWIISYNNKVKAHKAKVDGKEVTIPEHWEQQAQFRPHYKGLHALAMRTGRYWNINVSAVYEGQRVLENPLTGLHVVVESNGFVGEPQSYNPAYIDVTTRRKKDKKRIGWIGYFKQKNGFQKSVYMSLEEIEDHAQKYVKDYDRNPNWNDSDKRETMEMKTVFRQLMGWADLTGKENTKLAEALQADSDEPTETIEATAEDIQPETVDAKGKRTEADNMRELGVITPGNGGNPDPIDDKTWDSWLALCHRAEKFNVSYIMVDREKTTKSDLRAGYEELAAFVRDAKAQAQEAQP